MFSMEWICGQIAFIYAFNKIKPVAIVDFIIEAIVDTVVPGRGVGESNWFWHHVRSLERDGDQMSKELDIRVDLRNWDKEFPYFHHELIVRYIAGFLASVTAMFVWGRIRSLFVSSSYKRR